MFYYINLNIFIISIEITETSGQDQAKIFKMGKFWKVLPFYVLYSIVTWIFLHEIHISWILTTQMDYRKTPHFKNKHKASPRDVLCIHALGEKGDNINT